MTKVLVVLTSHGQLGDTGKPTGYWLEEFAAPYYTFLEAGFDVTLASPKGGNPPLDPNSTKEETALVKRFNGDSTLKEKLANTHKLSEVKADDYAFVFYPGGHGPVFDLASDSNSINLIQDFINQGKIVGSVCHGPAVLLKAKDKNGDSVVKGKKVTGFSNSEEEAIGATKAVPFLLETELKNLGASFEKNEKDWGEHFTSDGLIFTGQNPASSEGLAKSIVAAVSKK
eukprot:TRINITY_DN1437_c0_g1_i1.p1 TRINITY_DN1437_c0_g1~~TRINITY_DN1437_c0_g1_i1.p1  ORF type:complete len:228 (-),score=67.15 TRINITY_DN1437_c0_g1_i1:62-745(-)